MLFNPKVSIVIPVYNGEKYVREAIDSALNQTYKNIEVIVVNDGSTDHTEEIALSYGDKIRYFKKENSGQSNAYNFGIQKMTGEYFSLLGHDDIYYPDKVEVQIEFLSNLNNKNVVLYSNFEDIDFKSRLIKVKEISGINPENIRYQMLISTPINAPTALVPKELIKIGFDESKPMTSDVDLWFKLASMVPVIHIPQVLHKNRIHSGQSTFLKPKKLLKETNDHLITCMEKLTPEELFKMSGEKNVTDVYSKLALNFASREYLFASLKAVKYYSEFYKKENKYYFYKIPLLQIKCYLAYIKKATKNKLKNILFTFGLMK